jgi:hypothetical protein
MKSMHRLMMTSSAYRQASTVTPTQEKLDHENLLLSRMPMKRMEAEVLYDTLLLVSGRLDERRYGLPDPVQGREDGLKTPLGTERGWRRSIYVRQRRTQIPTLLESFDLPSMSPNCLERTVSTVAPQALHLLNNKMVRSLAGFLAERVQREVGTDPARQIEKAYWIALSRPPGSEEKKVGLETLLQLRTKWPKTASLTELTKGNATLLPANSVAESNALDGPSPREFREATTFALAKFCHILMNSAAFLYID